MAIGNAGRLLQLVNRLRRVAPSAARVTSSATRSASGAAKVTGGATKAASTAKQAQNADLLQRLSQTGMRNGKFNGVAAVGDTFKGLGTLATRVAPVTLAAGIPIGGTVAAGVAAKDILGPSVGNAMSGDGFIVGADGVARESIADGRLTIRDGQDVLTKFGLADQIRARLGLGPTKSKIVEAGQAQKNTQFQQLSDAQYLKTEASDGFQLQAGFLDRKPGETQAEYESRISPEVARLKRFKQATGNPDIAGKLTGNETVAQMNQMASRAADERFDSPLQIALRNEAARIAQDKRASDQMALANKQSDYQFRISQARMDHNAEQAEKTRQQTLQFKIFDRQDARAERADRADLRDRQDRRAAIASMTKGLAQLGYAFAM